MSGSLDELLRLLAVAQSVDASAFDEGFVLRSLRTRQAQTGAQTENEYLTALRDDPAEAETFVASLQIGHSEFFRNALTFAAIEQVVLPTLLADRDGAQPGELRIWSAGCAAGQEAYSIAILTDRINAARGGDVRWRIFATDRSEPLLEAARLGVYPASALQNVPLRHLEQYFTRTGDSYAIASCLRDRVDFSAYDLLDGRTASPPASVYGDFDLILCCNLLFYYRADLRQQIVAKLQRSLRPGGYLVTGEAERAMIDENSGFRAVGSPPAVFQRR